jgi:predicted nuclease of predicted toxin-antitoxin system
VTVWLDNHLSPALARWIAEEFGEPCLQVRDLGLARAADNAIFMAARLAATVFVTKDRDFAELVERLGTPPGVVLLSCGNTSTAYLRDVLGARLGEALTLIRAGEPLVEIGGFGD